MKSLQLFILMMLLITSSIAQEKNIETLSVSVENLIPFIVENYSASDEENELEAKNITFLIQTSSGDLSSEDKVIFKYAFKLLSQRLSEDDIISIVAYSGLNGLALDSTSPKDTKKLLHTIENLKVSIKEFHPDGIDIAYAHAKENFDDEAHNSVVMIRNPNVSTIVTETEATEASSIKPKAKNNAVLLTAITLLPEILAVIKN